MQRLGGEVSSLNHVAEDSKGTSLYFSGMELQIANFDRRVRSTLRAL
jgi:hypothetical protein